MGDTERKSRLNVEVEFISLGDSANRLDVKLPTLRYWVDSFEKIEEHFVHRNHRDERIFNKDDLEIFEFVRDFRDEHGRRTRTEDIVPILKEIGMPLRKERPGQELSKKTISNEESGTSIVTQQPQVMDVDAFIEKMIEHPSFDQMKKSVAQSAASIVVEDLTFKSALNEVQNIKQQLKEQHDELLKEITKNDGPELNWLGKALKKFIFK